ncbi:MAG: class I SAM-dependent methyltransferase [gamma proteobacterium endosymbiont of Lamellibrachia anaximandri]|nr:class I SAM-dependent methyltransferase [gamma proteobacterium endosymbiont of Lamellibrachia anaximandri]
MSSKAHWEKVYREKSPFEVSWYQKASSISFEMMEKSEFEGQPAIIDVGGGASVLVDRLLQEGLKNLTVLDISSTGMEYAKVRLGDRATLVNWIESDIIEFESPKQYDIWHDRAVFHFLTDAKMREKYLGVMRHSLKVDGTVIIAAFAIGGPTQCSGLDIVQYDAEKLKKAMGSEFVLIEQRNERHITPAEKHQDFGYYCFRRQV